MAEDFDLSKFITGSLSLRENSTPSVKPLHTCTEPYSSFWKEDPRKILGLVSFTERKQVSEDTIGTPIQEFYRGVNVFITGGTGFLGKVLVEKLLRDMPHIGHIYILIREKRGKSYEERFQFLMEDQIFLRLKAEVPHYHTKITPISGDISVPGLELSSEDRQKILESVQVVFHCAADVQFLEPLRIAINSNVLGSKHVLELAKQMTSLKSYMHVSTAYSQCVNKIVPEAVPKMNINYKEILHYVDSHTDSHIQDNLQRTLQEWPNTYTFTKAVCENMIQEEAGDLPICIFRPSIVTNTYKEPFRGWSDNLYGAGGLMLAGCLGILHHFKLDLSNSADMVPVDYVVNCMIAGAWSTKDKPRGDIQPYVLNFTGSPKITFHWKHLVDSDKLTETWPLNHSVWYPSVLYTSSEVLDKICHFFLHSFQGMVMDTAAVLVGQKPRLRKVYSSIYKAKSVLSYFTDGVWDFKNENVLELWHSMTKEDKNIFNFDVSDVNLLESKAVCFLGMRYFYFKESMESIPATKRKMKWFRLAHVTLKLAFGFVVLKLAVQVAHILPI